MRLKVLTVLVMFSLIHCGYSQNKSTNRREYHKLNKSSPPVRDCDDLHKGVMAFKHSSCYVTPEDLVLEFNGSAEKVLQSHLWTTIGVDPRQHNYEDINSELARLLEEAGQVDVLREHNAFVNDNNTPQFNIVSQQINVETHQNAVWSFVSVRQANTVSWAIFSETNGKWKLHKFIGPLTVEFIFELDGSNLPLPTVTQIDGLDLMIAPSGTMPNIQNNLYILKSDEMIITDIVAQSDIKLRERLVIISYNESYIQINIENADTNSTIRSWWINTITAGVVNEQP